MPPYPPRFWLFAPFIGLAALALIGFGLWHWAAGNLRDELRQAGVSWQTLEPRGFPARISLDVTAPAWRDGTRAWQTQKLSLTMLPFQGGHAIVDFLTPHHLRTDALKLRLRHQGNLASLVVDRHGFSRASFEAKQPRLTAQILPTRQTHIIAAETLELHGRRSAAAAHMDVALSAKTVTLAAATEAAAGATPISRLDMLATVPDRFLQHGPQAGQKLALERLTLERGELTLIARGTVKLAADGFVKGRLDVEALRLHALLDVLQELELVSARDRAKWLFLGGLGAALGGNPQERLGVPLLFKNRRTLLGPLDLGPAPRWQ